MRIIVFLLIALSLSFGKIRVVATYPYIGDLVKRLGSNRVEVFTLAKGTEDPHFVVPKPSFIAKLRRADLLVINGAYLEAGFLPPLLERVGNPEIMPGSEGFLDLSESVELIEKPKTLSREAGDIHPAGNPHFYLDPENVPLLAESIKNKLCEIDSAGCPEYSKNLERFKEKWQKRMREWEIRMEKFRGIAVVSYHSVFNYFLRHYRIRLVGTLEPKPGIPPTPGHIERLLKLGSKISFVLQDVYHERRTAQRFAQLAGSKVLVLPHDVGSLKDVVDIFSLFETIVRRFEND